MGLESYNFQMVSELKTSSEELEKILFKCGFVKLKKHFDSIYYEQVKKTSILELQVILDEKSQKIMNISIRFCISNPIKVIDDFFAFLKELSRSIPIKVYEFQGDKLIYSKKVEEYEYVKEKAVKHKAWFENLYGKVDSPIRCGDEYWEYVQKHKLGKAKWATGVKIKT